MDSPGDFCEDTCDRPQFARLRLRLLARLSSRTLDSSGEPWKYSGESPKRGRWGWWPSWGRAGAAQTRL
eukprot:12296684-Alexandrium_andersonii.AAC.1